LPVKRVPGDDGDRDDSGAVRLQTSSRRRLRPPGARLVRVPRHHGFLEQFESDGALPRRLCTQSAGLRSGGAGMEHAWQTAGCSRVRVCRGGCGLRAKRCADPAPATATAGRRGVWKRRARAIVFRAKTGPFLPHANGAGRRRRTSLEHEKQRKKFEQRSPDRVADPPCRSSFPRRSRRKTSKTVATYVQSL